MFYPKLGLQVQVGPDSVGGPEKKKLIFWTDDKIRAGPIVTKL